MTFRSAGHSVLTSLGKSEFVQQAHQYVCTAKWRMHAYECGLKTRDSAMINVTGGNAWLIDDASASLAFIISVSFPQSPYSSWSSPIIKRSRSPAGKQHNGGRVNITKSSYVIEEEGVCV